MNILFLSFYYPPDLSAGSFRAESLVEALSKKQEVSSITVITSSPNRYRGYSIEAPEREQVGNVTIIRCPVPAHASGMLDQARTFSRYARKVMAETKSLCPDIVVGTSSRLMTALLSALVAMRLDTTLYLDIRDLFSETIGDVLGGRKGRIARSMFELLERFTFGRAARLNVVSAGFVPYVSRYVSPERIRTYTNGVDDLFVENAPLQRENASDDLPRLIVYAGNIGEGQGLERVLPYAANHLGHGWRILVVGDGGTRQKLEDALKENGTRNVEIAPPVNRKELLEIYRRADVLFLHLNRKAAFEKVLPSKIFEYAATGKPVLAGVAGHAARFLDEYVENSAVFEPGDDAGMVQSLKRLELRTTLRSVFIKRFSRRHIAAAMADDILASAGAASNRIAKRIR